MSKESRYSVREVVISTWITEMDGLIVPPHLQNNYNNRS